MLFSVVVPVYNVEKYLHECVDSILSQTFTDFELILVDDGSKDHSGTICDEYAQKDSRVRVIHKENGGQSTARNRGVEEAQGKYVVFLDSDDFFTTSDFFSDLKEKAEEGAEVIIFRYYKYYSPERKEDCNVLLANITFENKGELLESLVRRDAFFCSCWSKCVALRILKENGIKFDENLRCEDMDWYYSVVEKAERFALIDTPYVNYRQRENSVTSTLNIKSIEDNITTIKRWWERFDAKEEGLEKEALLSSLAKLYCNLLISYSRDRKALKAYGREIMSYKPLLKYSMNPRTRTIYKFSKIFGLNLACVALGILDKMRK